MARKLLILTLFSIFSVVTLMCGESKDKGDKNMKQKSNADSYIINTASEKREVDNNRSSGKQLLSKYRDKEKEKNYMSKKILIIGATGSIGNKLRKTLLEKTDYELTLFSRRADKIKIDKIREKAVSGNVNSKAELEGAIANLVLRLIEDEESGIRESLGINRPEIK